jgi:hypothetical protein
LWQIYALQTEALLMLVRYQEAYVVYDDMPKFSVDWCNKIFGTATSAYLLMIGALVYLASGRFVKINHFLTITSIMIYVYFAMGMQYGGKFAVL